jgi:hypothetical protein
MAKKTNSTTWKVNDKKPKKTRQGISRNSNKKYRGQGGPAKRRKK